MWRMVLLIIFFCSASISGIAIDDFHCKVPTCRDFYYGLRHLPRSAHYVDVCYETVFALQAIPQHFGKCIDERDGMINSPCIHALAGVIKSCIDQLDDLPEREARFYCGYTLMKYCSIHLALDRYPQSLV